MINYEQKYKEALELAKQVALTKENVVAIEYIFPELAESRDEKIRKKLIRLFKDGYSQNSSAIFAGVKVEDIIAWLEKQKPVEWSEEDEKKINRITHLILSSKAFNREHRDEVIAIIKSLRPQKHWKPSKEQISILVKVMHCVSDTDTKVLKELLEQLKALK